MGNRTARLAIGLLLAAAAGCAILGLRGGEEPALRFSHRAHPAVDGACAACHGGERLSYSLPTHPECLPCHEAWIGADEESKPGPSCLKCHTTHDGKFRRPFRAPLADAQFSHDLHQKVDCAACHEATLAEPAAFRPVPHEADEFLMRMEACVACHAREALSTDCAECHLKTRKGLRPASHDGLFRESHGRSLLAGRLEFVCLRCHSEATMASEAHSQAAGGANAPMSCEGCHAVDKPRDHTPVWEKSIHGRLLALDRTRCVVCHRATFCNDCHANTEPDGHRLTADFKTKAHATQARSALRSCFTCHTFSDTCGKCHVK